MRKEPTYRVLELEIHGEAGAGSVIPFVSRGERIPVAIPENGVADEHYGTLIVRGISLTNDGIADGDLLILRKNITRKDIKRDTICAVYIRSTGDLVAKKLRYGNRGDDVTLRSSGGNIPDIHYHADDIEVRGIAIGFQRLLPNDKDAPF